MRNTKLKVTFSFILDNGIGYAIIKTRRGTTDRRLPLKSYTEITANLSRVWRLFFYADDVACGYNKYQYQKSIILHSITPFATKRASPL